YFPRTEHLENPSDHHGRETPEMEPVSQQCSSCLSLQLFGVEAHSFLPHGRAHSPLEPSCIKIVQRTGACAGRYGSSFEQTLHILIVVVIQATHRDALAVALQFASHPAVLTTIVNLHGKTAVCPKLALAAETVRCLQQCNQ